MPRNSARNHLETRFEPTPIRDKQMTVKVTEHSLDSCEYMQELWAPGLCHLPRHGKRKVAAQKLKLGK